MRLRPVKIGAWVLVAVLFSCGKGPRVSASTPVTCFCFLNTHPCESSRRLEDWTRGALQEAFPADLQSGRLVIQTLNYEKPGQEHYLKDYDLPFQSIVLQEGPPKSRWLRLDGLWRYLGDQAGFRKMVQDETAEYLAGDCRQNPKDPK